MLSSRGSPNRRLPHTRGGCQTPKDTEKATTEGPKALRGGKGIWSPAVFVTGLWQLLGHRARQSPLLELERRDTGDVERTGLL